MEKNELEIYINECWKCRNHCQETLFNYCLNKGGAHVEAAHVKLMFDCIQVCQLAADAMTRCSVMHHAICLTCAETCEACAESCEAINDNVMKKCAQMCRSCAQSCREMIE